MTNETAHGCQYAHDRVKSFPTNFYEEVNKEERYSDSSFKRENAVFFHDGGLNELNSNLARH